ncbi:MAG: ketopantoate reductase family protein [Acidobacteriota bacterium]
MKFVVLGAGAIGSYFGACLSRSGHEVHFLARGDHGEAIRSAGIRIREPEGNWTMRVPATARPDDLPPADFAILAVKSYSLAEIAPVARRVAEQGAVLMPLLNGVEAFESLVGQGVPAAAVLPGLAVISVERTAPGEVTRKSAFRSVVAGEHAGGPSARAERVVAALSATGCEARVSDDIGVDLWRKFLFLASMAGACGLGRASIGPVRTAPLGRRLLERAIAEIATVGRARGVAIPAGEEDRVLERIGALPPEMKPSFLLDVERGGPTELDVLSAAVSRYGRETGVATPVHDTVTAAISASLRL